MSRPPRSVQLCVIAAILLSSFATGVGIKGISAGLGVLYVMPQCEIACRADKAAATDFIIRMGHRVHSTCECSNGAHLPSSAGDTAGAVSFLATALVLIASWWLFLMYLLRKAEARRAGSRRAA